MTQPALPASSQFEDAVLVQALLGGEDWLNIEQCFKALSVVAQRHGYDQWVTASPKESDPLPKLRSAQPGDLEPQGIRARLVEFLQNMVVRKWDESKAVWLARRVDMAIPEHPGEHAIHPELLGVLVPPLVVAQALEQAKRNLNHQALTQQVAQDLPEGEGPYAEGFRDAMESLLLALKDADIDPAILKAAVQTSLDAYGNNADDEWGGTDTPAAVGSQP